MGCSDVEVLVEVELAVAVPLTAGVGWVEPCSRVTEVDELEAETLATAMVVPRFPISPLRLLV